MRVVRDLQTGTKLLVAFSLVCASLLFVGWSGASGLADVSARSSTMYRQNLVGLVAIDDATVALWAVGRHTQAAMHQRTQQGVDRHLGKVGEFEVSFRDALQRAIASGAVSADAPEVTELRRAFDGYSSICRETIGLHVQGQTARGLTRLTEAAGVGDRVRTLARELRERQLASARTTQATIEGTSRRLRGRLVGAIVLGFGLAVVLGIGLARLIARPLQEAANLLREVARGDFTGKLALERRDEVGVMAEALNEAIERQRETLLQVRASADEVASVASQLTAAAGQVSTGAQEQAASLEETSAALSELTTASRQSAETAQEAGSLATDSRALAEEGGKVVGRAVEAIREVKASSGRIASITGTIDEIAFQTNLLALNASVEAARAGEQGRGFAVVATEVRNLAQRSAAAAKEIKGLIQEASARVAAGAGHVDASGERLSVIVERVTTVSALVGSIATTARQQSEGIDQVNKALGQVDQVTQSNASQTEELSATAEALLHQSQSLKELVASFTLERETLAARSRRSEREPSPEPLPRSAPGQSARRPRATRPARVSNELYAS